MSDFYRLDQQLSDDERKIVKAVQAFVSDDVLPVINDFWERAEFPHHLVPAIANLGIVGGTVEGYGAAGLSHLATGLVTRELSRGDGSINAFFGVHSGLSMGTIDLLGSEEQKQRWLPAMARLEKIGAFGLTEPNHGSDSVALETTAARNGDTWVINGKKRWIGNASFADLVIIWARDTADSRVKAFVVEQPDGDESVPGYTTEIITGKIGKRAVLQPDVFLENVQVAESNRLVHAESFRDVSRVLTRTRGGVSWEAVGHAMACYDVAVSYTGSREQFGKPIASFQLVQNRLAWMLTELTAMQLICQRMADLQAQGEWTVEMASMAKMHTSSKAREICSSAKELLGGNGLLLEHHVARHLTDMEVVHTYEGTEFMQSLILGREITGISAFV
ncbi:acyl-CoA dehydrogenase family protein [Paeniglutamicibacter sp. MACA_103]|uniref:acyl-CoA dehydrogenase family protein n=1 Tax=Paeniglutamicibacter sp. MACA_103 TaxID=3377337 RepID=UPI0038939BE3